MSKWQRRKGHNFERAIAQQLRPIFPKVRRKLEYQIDQCIGIDLEETGRYKFQCKKLKAYAPVSTIEEVKCDQMLGDVPVVVTAGDSLPAMAILPWEEFLRLLQLSLAPAV